MQTKHYLQGVIFYDVATSSQLFSVSESTKNTSRALKKLSKAQHEDPAQKLCKCCREKAPTMEDKGLQVSIGIREQPPVSSDDRTPTNSNPDSKPGLSNAPPTQAGYVPSFSNPTILDAHERVRSFIDSLPGNPDTNLCQEAYDDSETPNGPQELIMNDTKAPLLAWPASSQCENVTPISDGMVDRRDSEYSMISLSETSSMDSAPPADPLHTRIKHWVFETLEPIDRMRWDLYILLLMVWISIVTPYTVCFSIPVGFQMPHLSEHCPNMSTSITEELRTFSSASCIISFNLHTGKA